LASWKDLMPEYQIKLWNESSLDLDRFPFANEALKFGKYAFVSDVVRLLALYEEGGIYLDTDVLVLKSFNDLLDHSFFTGEYKAGALNAAVIGSEAGQPILKNLLEYYESLEFNPKKPKTIPEVFDKFLLNDRIKNIKIYPPEFFYPLPLDRKEMDYSNFLTANSFCVHLWNHSWIDEFMLLKQFRFYESFVLNFRHVIISPAVYFTYSHQTRYFNDFYLRIKMYLHQQVYGEKKD
jgi:mannosyltransferase OCH1-like enzyme